MSRIDDTLEAIDNKLDELEVLVSELPLNAKVKANLVNQIYAFYEEVEGAIDLTPTDWE